MKILRFDSVGGASGDMILSALADLGVDMTAVERAVAALGIGPLRIAAEKCCRHGIAGTVVTVHTDEPPAAAQEHEHGHAHEHGHEHGHGHVHAHRTYRDIRELIDRSGLPEPVRALSLRVFGRLAAAEGRIHGKPAEDIAFHEVGAADSIADIVGACWALRELGVEAVECGPLPLGSGTVECAHGRYPLPAPATVELLRGFPVEMIDEQLETVTPTGAALLVEWCAMAPAPSGGARRIAAAGYGFGHREFKHRPNVLRASLMETAAAVAGADACLVLEAEMDDCTGEWMGALTAKLMEAGALDVYTTAVQMKKNRPGMLLTVLCRPVQRDALLDLVFRGGTTLGVREYAAARTVLERRIETVRTRYGEVRVKLGIWKGDVVIRAPEMDDCVARAAEHGVSARAVHEAAGRTA